MSAHSDIPELCRHAQNGHLARVQYMVEIQNIDPDLPNPRISTAIRTALHFAAAYDRVEIVRYLVDKGHVVHLDSARTCAYENDAQACIAFFEQKISTPQNK